MERAVNYGLANAPDLATAAESARAARLAATAADASFAKLPPDRRARATTTLKMAWEIGKAAAQLGGEYSGDTGHHVNFSAKADARTDTQAGDRYSRSCKYSKTDATHIITLAPAGIPCLVESEALRLRSIADGLHLISLAPDGAAVWVRSVGKAIKAEAGWVAGNASVCYHSTKSAADAQAGFARKLSIMEREQKLARAAGKIERRARLISRLCDGAVATIDDARALGYCLPGITAFQSAHKIGESATLPDLVRTGNGSAIALALSVARKIAKKKELASA